MKNAKADLYEFIEQLRARFGINASSYPLNTIDICLTRHNAEINFHKFKTNGFCAGVFLGDKVDTIILNSMRNDREINFDCGHELIHMTKHRDKGFDTFSCMAKPKPELKFLEWEANEGSAELLVPYTSFIPEISDAYHDDLSWSAIDKLIQSLAERYFVTAAVIRLRIQHLRFEIFQYRHGVKIDNLKLLSDTQQRNNRIIIKSIVDIRNDKYNDCYVSSMYPYL